jgi:hypothetical protein
MEDFQIYYGSVQYTTQLCLHIIIKTFRTVLYNAHVCVMMVQYMKTFENMLTNIQN